MRKSYESVTPTEIYQVIEDAAHKDYTYSVAKEEDIFVRKDNSVFVLKNGLPI